IEGVKFTVEGHTDNVPMNKGSKYPDNDRLSLARANSVKEIFLKEKVKSENISTVGMGDSKPIESNETSEGRQANRRIEIVADKDLSEIPELEGLLEEE
ncbi:MAG TPA: OmpA family protein, partial [Leptospiraceae bacterium]|nr:OmpA family protein [Leptospiraceae bacterium]